MKHQFFWLIECNHRGASRASSESFKLVDTKALLCRYFCARRRLPSVHHPPMMLCMNFESIGLPQLPRSNRFLRARRKSVKLLLSWPKLLVRCLFGHLRALQCIASQPTL
jgi:hypothetical protein